MWFEVVQLLYFLYEKFDDNINVLEYKNVLGLKKNVYFVFYYKEDWVIEDIYLYVNEFEVFYIECLVNYLLK